MSEVVARVRSLDSVRGLAALIVVLHHCLLAFPDKPRWFAFSPMRLIDAGGQGAVLVFFALSGYVLHLTFLRKDDGRFWSYAVKRVTRIYLPFAAAILLAATLLLLVPARGISGASAWLVDPWRHPIDAPYVLAHLAMTDWPAFQQLDNVMWSLVHEMRISLVFPLIALGVAARWRSTVALCSAVSLAAALWWWSARPELLFDPVSTARYLALFAAGAAICRNQAAIMDRLRRLSLAASVAGWGLGLLLITIPEARLGSVPACVGAVLILILGLADPWTARALNARALVWLGAISYSLYLVHLPVIGAVVRLLPNGVPLPVALALGVAASLGVAELGQRFVERPSQLLGRFASARLVRDRHAHRPAN